MGKPSTGEGRQIDVSRTQFANADSPRSERLEPDSNVTCERLIQFLKQPPEMLSVDEGIQTERRDMHCAKARSHRRETWQRDLNVNVLRDMQSQKQAMGRVWTCEGMQIGRSGHEANADLPSVEILGNALASKSNPSRRRHFLKQEFEMFSIDAGIRMDRSDSQQ
jgi:hypothetical protein